MTQTNDPRKVKVIVELIDHTSKIAEAADRGDLAERMSKAKARISDPQIRVVIAGHLKQGKSQLLNSLLNVPVSRVGDDETTVVATMVSYGEQATAKLMVAGTDEGVPDAIEIPIADIKNDLRRHPAAGGRQVLRVAVTANSPLLKGGLVFVDTPGVGGHGQPHLSATLGLLPDADAMLMITDTSQEFTEPEMTFIRQSFEICPVATIVATKTDLYPHWREIVEANKAHLQRAGLSIPMIPASSVLRSHAIQLNDKELNEESNFPAIVKFLSDKVLSRENDRVRDQVLAEIRSAAEHLTLAVDSELSALNDPGCPRQVEGGARAPQAGSPGGAAAGRAVAAGAQRRNRRSDSRCRPRPARPVPGYLTAHRARDRPPTRPTTGPRSVPNWRTRSPPPSATTSSGPISAPRRWPRRWRGPSSRPASRRSRCRRSTPAKWAPASAKSSRWPSWRPSRSRRHKVVTGMRGSYGGVLMFGMLTSFAGLGMFNPLSLGAGLLLGRKAYKEDMENRMMRVRNEAKMNMRRFVDDVSFVVNKESRDRLKGIQRQLRDHYRGIANQTTRSLNESLQATIASAQLEENERNTRIRELERQLNILKQVTDHAVKLAPGATEAAREPVGTT